MVKYTSFRAISHGSYAADYEIHHLPKVIEEFENEWGLILNPDFQRGHVWAEKQQVRYIEFLLQGGNTGRDFYFNCPCWHNRVKDGEYDDFVCVDGLQRITAILRFINNEIKVFGSYYKEYTDKPDLIRHSVRIHVNDLKTRKEVLQWYLEMNSGGTPHTQSELARVQKLLDEAS